MSRPRLSLEQFLGSDLLRNDYVRYKSLTSYVRKSTRLIDGRRVRALDRANTNNRAAHRRSGIYHEFDDLMKTLAVQHSFDGVYVENVLSDFLPNKLREWGYRLVSGDSLTPCFWWQPTDV